jgi:acyl-coenzyme A thioesterase PaaI-like protein
MTPANPQQNEQTAQQPSSRMCFVCGVENAAGLRIKFFNDGPNACRADVVLGYQHQGYPGVVHGGIIATMLDEAMGRAAMSGNTERFMFTAKIEVRYRQLVPLDRPLTLVARIEKDRGRLATAVAELRLEDGTLAAEASGMLAEIPPQERARMESEREGWKVYP